MDLFRSTRFTSRVEELIEKYHVPGLSIAIVHNEIVASKGFGHASFDPPRPMTADTLFDIASASKSLTAASVALLVDDDEKYPDVKYEAAVSKLLPGDFVMPGHEHEGVTVEDILSHRSGMPPHDWSYLGPQSERTDDARSVTRNLRNLCVAAPIRTKFMYSNIMFTVATYLVERKSGLTFSDFLHKHFFGPLGMTSTNLQPQSARDKGLGDRITPGHFWDQKTKNYLSFDFPDAPEAQGAGSIITSVNDYIKYVKAMMHQERPFTNDIYNGLVKSRALPNPGYEKLNPYTSPAMYAAGWQVCYYRGHMFVVHGGSIAGIITTHFFLPDLKFGGTIFGNSLGAKQVGEVLTQELIDEVLKIPDGQMVDWDRTIFERHNSGNNGETDEEQTERQKLCPRIGESEPQKMPLSVYTGEYWNVGYCGIKVQIKNGKLFIDANDRSLAFSLFFEHICEQTKYIAFLRNPTEGTNIPLRAEFRFENGLVIELGIRLERDLDDYIWFHRVRGLA